MRYASHRLHTPARAASRTVSVSSMRSSRERPAPSASRTAISCWRAEARDNSSVVTLALVVVWPGSGGTVAVTGAVMAGAVTTWAWVFAPRRGHPLSRPFAWALIRLDGADTALLHVVDAGDESRMRTGMRVTPRWREERVGDIHDIEAFVPEEA